MRVKHTAPALQQLGEASASMAAQADKIKSASQFSYILQLLSWFWQLDSRRMT
jgi:septal ring-binding cell division protein DamX